MCTYPAFPNYQWGDGDTLDREHVRDIILQGPKFVEDRQLNCLAIQEVN